MSVPIVALEPDHVAFADKVAAERRRLAVEKGRPPANDAPTDHTTALAMDVLGARAEAAGKLFLNPIKWHHLSDDVSDLADLEGGGVNVDVKGIEKDWHSLIVQAWKPEDWAYLLVSTAHHPDYWMLGWLWGHEVKQEQNWRTDTGRPAYFVGPDALRPAQELREAIHGRPALADKACAVEGCSLYPLIGTGASILHNKRGIWHCAQHWNRLALADEMA